MTDRIVRFLTVQLLIYPLLCLLSIVSGLKACLLKILLSIVSEKKLN